MLSTTRGRVVVAAVVAVAILAVLAWVRLNDPARDGASVVVTAVEDTRTLRVEDDPLVSVIGIEPFESVQGQPSRCGPQVARPATVDLAEGQQVVLRLDADQPDVDRAGRLLRYVELADGADLGEELIVAGRATVAEAAGSFERRADYERAEREARSGGAGLWSC